MTAVSDAPHADLPSVTVLITTYNYGHFVCRAIESGLEQEYPASKLEILVVDDGSTDGTPELVKERFGDRVRYVRKPNGGLASALNVGFRKAGGDIVCPLDADDYFYPGKIRLVADEFRKHPDVGVVYEEFEIVDTNGLSIGKTSPEPTWTGHRIPLNRIPRQLQSLILLGHPWSSVMCAMSIRTTLLREVQALLPSPSGIGVGGAGVTIPEEAFPHSPDLFLYLVLPFMAPVSVIETAQSAYVFHGENAELFRSSAENREAHTREMAYARRFIETRFGVRFLAYLGRGIYGPADDGELAPGGTLSRYLREARQIASADVEPKIKRASQTKLAASLLLPGPMYGAAQSLRARARHLRSRGLRRRITAARG